MTPRERLFALEHFGIKLGLDTIRALVEGLHRPDRAWPAVHVAGTNGKGSVTAMVERGLRAAGHRTGRYTSPHLDRIEERIAIDGHAVAPDLFDAVVAEVLAVVDDRLAGGALPGPPTFFEVTTAVAFEIFRRAGVTAAVIEVGLGGRFDATNVITPAVTAITAVAFDHERHLGRTLPAIAFEKAGIIKPGVPVVVGAQAAAAHHVIAREAERAQAPLVAATDDYLASARLTRGRATIELHTPAARYPAVTLGLNGEHQIANAIVAARTLEVAAERGLAVRAGDVATALAEVEWPARLEWLRVKPDRDVLIDAAHNPAGAEALARYLAAAGVAPIALVMGVMKDKDVAGILRALAPVTSAFVATEADSSRALDAATLAGHARALMPAARVTSRPQADAAVAAALHDHTRVCVAGSIFLAGPLRARLLAGGATSRRCAP